MGPTKTCSGTVVSHSPNYGHAAPKPRHMATQTTVIRVYAERYRHVPERIMANKTGCYQELQELLYLVTHTPDTSPEQEALRLVEALQAGHRVRPRFYALSGQLTWAEVRA